MVNLKKRRKNAVSINCRNDEFRKELIIRQALHLNSREKFRVCILYHLEGWQIDSKEPHKVTIAKMYGKSEKTIRLWLHKAQEILMDYRGRNKMTTQELQDIFEAYSLETLT